MSQALKNTLVLVILLITMTGLGFYMTQVAQSGQLEELEARERLLRLKQAEVETLLVEEASSAQMAEESLRKWRSRYKVIPDSLTSPQFVRHLNTLSQSGFRNFDITLDGERRSDDFHIKTYRVTGRAFYTSLYDLIWRLENERQMYRVRDVVLNRTEVFSRNPTTGIDRQQIMVTFIMNIDAFYQSLEGASAPDGDISIPANVLPNRRPAANPFYPIVMQDLPPNTDGHVDVESATLVSILGSEVVFRDNDGFRTLTEGDQVYLGRITNVDPKEGRVVARLNKGGIVDEIEINIHEDERYRRALGAVRLIPIEETQ